MNETIESYFVKRHAYSYIRFSSAAQSEGDSFRRQLARTEEFCQRNNLLLADTRFEDLGVSGWTGKNIEKGALGDFIAAVKAGKVPKGSVLVLENLDRFSRLKPRKAYDKLAEIIENGVDVVTLEDGKFHTKETIDDFATLISSYAVMQRANEESSRKSSLVRAAAEQKRKLAMAGKGIITSHCPAWLRVNKDRTGFEPIPERVQLIKRVVRMMKAGKGKREIARTFDLEGIPVWSRAKRWRDNYILELVKSRTLLGEMHPIKRKQPHAEPIKNYYPAVLDEETWLSVQPEKRSFTAGPQSDVGNLFSGLLFDGYNPDYRMKFFLTDKGKGYSYLQSDYQSVDPVYQKRREAKDKGKPLPAKPLSSEMLRYQKFEEHFLQHFTELDLHDTLPAPVAAETSRVDLLEKEQADNAKALTNLVKALEGGETSAVVMAQIKKREDTARRLARELAVETQKVKRVHHAADSFEEEQARLESLMRGKGRDARLALRAAFHRIIDRIEIYMAGLLEVPKDLKTIVYPDRNGMMCYSIKLVGGQKVWIWWDGCVVWD